MRASERVVGVVELVHPGGAGRVRGCGGLRNEAVAVHAVVVGKNCSEMRCCWSTASGCGTCDSGLGPVNVPRSAGIVSWPRLTCCLAIASARRALARSAVLREATIQPTTRWPGHNEDCVVPVWAAAPRRPCPAHEAAVGAAQTRTSPPDNVTA